MGVILSTSSTLAPISFASSVIGFVSFAFTLATFLRITWTNLETMAEPAHAVHSYLNTLREELLEERASLRALRRANKHRRRSRRKLPETLEQLIAVELDEVTLKTMGDVVRTLIKDFKELERPFLQEGEDGIQQAKRRGAARRRTRGGASPSSQYGDSAYAYGHNEKRGRSDERAAARDDDEEDDMYWAQRVHYGRYNVHRRMIWLYKKSSAEALYDVLSKMQTRRISRQVNSMTIMMREYGDATLDVGDSLARIEDRLSRVVGLRRVD